MPKASPWGKIKAMNHLAAGAAGLISTVTVALLTPLIQWITNTVVTPDFSSTIRIYFYSIEQGMMSYEAAIKYFSLSN